MMPRGKKREDYSREPQPVGKAIAQGVIFAALCVALVFVVYKHASFDPAAVPPSESAGLVEHDLRHARAAHADAGADARTDAGAV